MANALHEQTEMVELLYERFVVAAVENFSLIKFIKTSCYVIHFERGTFYQDE